MTVYVLLLAVTATALSYGNLNCVLTDCGQRGKAVYQKSAPLQPGDVTTETVDPKLCEKYYQNDMIGFSAWVCGRTSKPKATCGDKFDTINVDKNHSDRGSITFKTYCGHKT